VTGGTFDASDMAAQLVAGLPRQAAPTDTLAAKMVPGGSFILDRPDTTPAVWGHGSEVLWAEGEALMIVGPNGVGKTTLGTQIVKARLGLQRTVLGLPVTPTTRRVLYLAMDRPAQIARAMGRVFCGEDRMTLDERLIFWKGPPPLDLAKHPSVLTEMCRDADADTVVVDSLKDAALGLSEDEVGAGWNRARQGALASGVEVLELHHPKKAGAGGAPPTTLSDVYGSAWLTAGAGSVISLHGEAGDPIVSMRHHKQPVEEVGPWRLQHDHTRGVTGIWHHSDLVAMAVKSGTQGITTKTAAAALFEAERPTPAQCEKARRKLTSLVAAGLLVEHNPGAPKPVTWHAAATHILNGVA